MNLFVDDKKKMNYLKNGKNEMSFLKSQRKPFF